MDRRQFCKTSFVAGLAVGSPLLAGCGRRANTEASIPAISLDGAEIELSNAAIQELSESLSGPMILSGHPDYDTARTIWNGMHDKRPALIVRPADSRDVSQSVSFARDNDLLLAVRGGGHSWPGKSVCDGGLMIDLSPMNSVVADRNRLAERYREMAQKAIERWSTEETLPSDVFWLNAFIDPPSVLNPPVDIVVKECAMASNRFMSPAHNSSASATVKPT